MSTKTQVIRSALVIGVRFLVPSSAEAQQLGCDVVIPRAFRLLETQTPGSEGPEYPAQTHVRAIALGSGTQGRTRAVRVRIDSAEGWLYLWPSQIRGCPEGSIAQRAGDVPLGGDAGVAPDAGPGPAAPAQSPATPPSPPPPVEPTPAPPSPPVQHASVIGTTVTPSWTAPGGDPLADAMSRRARVFAPGFIAVTDMLRIRVPRGPGGMIVPGTIGPGFCYRIIVATTAVAGTELVLAPLGGDLVQGEQAPDGGTLLGYQRPLCISLGSPPVSTRLRLRSLVASGEAGLQIFATPFGG